MFCYSSSLRQRNDMRPGVDPQLRGIPMSHLRHIAMYVPMYRVFQERKPPQTRFQHVPIPSGWGMRLWRHICYEGNWVSIIYPKKNCLFFSVIHFDATSVLWRFKVYAAPRRRYKHKQDISGTQMSRRRDKSGIQTWTSCHNKV